MRPILRLNAWPNAQLTALPQRARRCLLHFTTVGSRQLVDIARHYPGNVARPHIVRDVLEHPAARELLPQADKLLNPSSARSIRSTKRR